MSPDLATSTVSSETLCDVGGAAGVLSIMVASRHKHIACVSADLPEVSPIAAQDRRFGLSDRIETKDIDFFREPLLRRT